MKKWMLMIVVSLAVLSLESCIGSGKVKVTESDQGYLFQEGDSPILFYQRAPKSFDGAYTRNNYLHPLWTLDGEVLTEDGPADHLHQRGIFWTWHQTYVGGQRLGDAWACQDFVWDVAEARVEDGPYGAKSLAVTVLWKSPLWVDEDGAQKPVVEEKTQIVVHPAKTNYRAIDVEIALRALADEVQIGGSEDEKGYGGFSARIEMPDDMLFISSGRQFEPQTNQVEAGPWMDFGGTFGKSGKKSGLAIFVHASNPGAVNKWMLRQKGSMQNAVYPGRERVPISQETSTLLKYRLIVHRGTAADLDIESLYGEYSK